MTKPDRYEQPFRRIGAVCVVAFLLALPAAHGAAACAVPATVATGAAPLLPMLRAACPELAILVEDSAMRDLGEAFPGQTSRAGPVYVTPVNDLAAFARDARGARDAGAAMHDFGEALYVTAVTAGVPRAVAATRVLLDVFAEDRSPCPVMPGPGPSI